MEAGGPKVISVAQVREEDKMLQDIGGAPGEGERVLGALQRSTMRCGGSKGSTSESFAIFGVPGRMPTAMTETEL